MGWIGVGEGCGFIPDGVIAGASVIGTNVILGMGSFSAIFRMIGLSSGELCDEFLLSVFAMFFSWEKINMLAPVTMIIIKIAIKMSRVFQILRRRGFGGVDIGPDWIWVDWEIGWAFSWD